MSYTTLAPHTWVHEVFRAMGTVSSDGRERVPDLT